MPWHREFLAVVDWRPIGRDVDTPNRGWAHLATASTDVHRRET